MSKRSEHPEGPDESETKKPKTDTETKKNSKTFTDEQLKCYLGFNNWQLSNEVELLALEQAFPDKEDQLDFLYKYKIFLDARLSVFNFIERNLPRDRGHVSYYQAKIWLNEVLTKPKRGAKMAIDRAEGYIKDLGDL